MNIIFNGIMSGFSNNGGSRTILKSAEVLRSLGHNVECLSNIDNFTWFDHKKPIKHIPENVDVVINIAAVDYNVTKQFNIPVKVAWWRAHEVWSNSEEVLRSYYLDTDVKNIVNSKGLQQKLKNEFGVESEVIYQGIDFNLWEDRQLRPSDKIRIGCLYTKQPRKRWRDFVKLASILGTKDYEYAGFGPTIVEEPFLDCFICCPTQWQLVNLYSSCHIWYAPTESEGLHNVPMESALCGCLVVCSDAPMNGMMYDYAFDNADPTAVIYKAGDIEDAAIKIQNLNYELIPRMQFYLKEFIGSRETNMKKFIDYLGGI